MLRVKKSFSFEGESGVGETVDFSITVENAGNVDLFDVALTDAMFLNDEGERCMSIGRVARKALELQMLRFAIHQHPCNWFLWPTASHANLLYTSTCHLDGGKWCMRVSTKARSPAYPEGSSVSYRGPISKLLSFQTLID